MRKSIAAMFAFGAALMSPAFMTAAHASNFQVDNKTSFTIKLLVNGVYKCTAEAIQKHPKNYCTTDMPPNVLTPVAVQFPDGKTMNEKVNIPTGKFTTWTVTLPK